MDDYTITFTQDDLIALNDLIEGTLDYFERENDNGGYLSEADISQEKQ